MRNMFYVNDDFTLTDLGQGNYMYIIIRMMKIFNARVQTNQISLTEAFFEIVRFHGPTNSYGHTEASV